MESTFEMASKPVYTKVRRVISEAARLYCRWGSRSRHAKSHSGAGAALQHYSMGGSPASRRVRANSRGRYAGVHGACGTNVLGGWPVLHGSSEFFLARRKQAHAAGRPCRAD